LERIRKRGIRKGKRIMPPATPVERKIMITRHVRPATVVRVTMALPTCGMKNVVPATRRMKE